MGLFPAGNDGYQHPGDDQLARANRVLARNDRGPLRLFDLSGLLWPLPSGRQTSQPRIHSTTVAGVHSIDVPPARCQPSVSRSDGKSRGDPSIAPVQASMSRWQPATWWSLFGAVVDRRSAATGGGLINPAACRPLIVKLTC